MRNASNSRIQIYILYRQLLKHKQMSERKIWKQDVRDDLLKEDRILKELFQNRKIKKWSQISSIMLAQFGIAGRNGKQCRERYHNHLLNGINKEQWTKQEEKKLIDLHVKYGNRWALISKQIPGRTDNCVKNMLYSRLRRAVRLVNKIIAQKFKKTYKPIKINFIFRLIEITQNYYIKSEQSLTKSEKSGLELKKDVLELEIQDESCLKKDEIVQIQNIIKAIQKFNKENKRIRGYKRIKVNREKASNKFLKEDKIDQANEFKEEKKIKQPKFRYQSGNKVLESEDENKYYEQQNDEVPKTIAAIVNKLPEINLKLKGKRHLSRLDSLESNRSCLLVDPGLEKPVLIDQQYNIQNLTPGFTPMGLSCSTNIDWNFWPNKWFENKDEVD